MNEDYRLRIFLAVADAGSLTKASYTLDISQPALSRHLKQLEQSIGKPLFRRHGRGVSLSSAGKQLYESIAPTFSQLDKVVGDFKTGTDPISGYLKIATVHTLNSYFVAPVLKSVCQEFSNLKLQIFERSSMDVSLLVERKQADIGLAYDTMVSGESLVTHPLHLEEMQVFYHPSLAVELNHKHQVIIDNGLPLVGLPSGYALRQMLNLKFAGHLNQRIQVETVDLMLEIVRTGMAACILPLNLPHRLIEQSGLIRRDIAQAKLQRQVVLITHKDNPSLAAVQYLIEKFTQQLKLDEL